MLKPAYLAGVSADVVDTFSAVEHELASEMAERMMRMGRISSTTQWQIERATEFGLFQGDVTAIMSKATKTSKRQINKLMAEAGMDSLAYDDKIYRKAGLAPAALKSSPALQAVLLQGCDSTFQLLGNFTKTTANAAQVAFTSLLDRSYIQIMSGAYSPTRAIQLAVRDLSSQGITKIAFPSGGYDSVEAAVRRCVTTGINQSISKLQLARAEEMGCELVETSSHAGARPSHAVWQGQVFSLSKKSREYKYFYDETGYGTGDGLCGWNCYHSFFPYFEGLSTRSFSEDPAADAGRDNDREYEEQQKQRYYERMVREAKRECTVLDAASKAAKSEEEEMLYKADFQRASAKLKGREKALQEYLDSTGRSREREREQVGGFNRSVSSKAVWAAKKAQK